MDTSSHRQLLLSNMGLVITTKLLLSRKINGPIGLVLKSCLKIGIFLCC